jgi:hypothetical protein
MVELPAAFVVAYLDPVFVVPIDRHAPRHPLGCTSGTLAAWWFFDVRSCKSSDHEYGADEDGDVEVDERHVQIVVEVEVCLEGGFRSPGKDAVLKSAAE